MPNDKDPTTQALIMLALEQWQRRDPSRDSQTPEPWRPGYIAPRMTARAAIAANVAIGRMMR